LDEINWDVPTNKDWDAVPTDTSKEFTGISLQEAQDRGLYTPQPTDAHIESADVPPVEDIDWNVPTDMDWDALIANTDQGFAGLDFEEAKRQGLVEDLDPDI
jgi:hypothetical protein